MDAIGLSHHRQEGRPAPQPYPLALGGKKEKSAPMERRIKPVYCGRAEHIVGIIILAATL